MKVAQHFSAGWNARKTLISPGGTAERSRNRSAVPTGLAHFRDILPSAEALGYCQIVPPGHQSIVNSL